MGLLHLYWVPEVSHFPAHDLWLTQLAPLASVALTSEGQPQVQAQNGQWGLPALVLLVCAFALFWLSRTRHWLGRTAMLAPAALGLVAALDHHYRTRRERDPVLTDGRRFAVDHMGLQRRLCGATRIPRQPGPAATEDLAQRSASPRRVCVVAAAPTAVGRWLFAPELREAGARLQSNTVALSRAALWTSSTVLLYLTGLLVGVAVWVAYQAWPPRREMAFIGRGLIVVGILIITAAIGWPATTQASKRVTAADLRQSS